MKTGSAWAVALAMALTLVPEMAAQQAALPDAPQVQDNAGPNSGAPTENPRRIPPDNSRNNSANSPAHSPQNTPGQSARGIPSNSAPPRSEEESSSNQTRIDLSPPKGDELAHPEDATGGHEWNPLRAMKDVEVGDFYYKEGNYKAALSRYREALQFKPRDAVATFKLAQTLEKSKDFEEARAQYEAYLSILQDGPSAGEARKALERLKKQ